MPNRPLDAQRRTARDRAPRCIDGVESQMVAAAGADACAFEDRRLAMRAEANLARSRGARRTHEWALSTFPATGFGPFSSQPNSTCPRILDPAETMSDAALTSPETMPVASSQTRGAG